MPEAIRAQGGAGVGSITGVIRDRAGDGIGEVSISIGGSLRGAVSDGAGRFLLDSIPAGPREILFERSGYLPLRTDLRVIADSALTLEITLLPDGQVLPGVRITARIRNRLFGVVIDERDQLMPGTRVDVVGSGRHAVTDSLGRFAFTDLAPGSYLVEVLRADFAPARYPVRMVEGVERSLSLRLRTGAGALTAAELHNAALATREATSRYAFRRRAETALITREELAPMGRAALDVALDQSPSRALFRAEPAEDRYCVLVDGVRLLGRGWLRSFYSDEVELIELYPANTDDSNTLCSRFTAGSGCACAAPTKNPPTVVIWMRR